MILEPNNSTVFNTRCAFLFPRGRRCRLPADPHSSPYCSKHASVSSQDPCKAAPRMPRRELTDQLKGGDRRSIGRSNQIVSLVLRQPHQFAQLMKCLWSENPVVRMRAADAIEKISGQKPEWLRCYKGELLGLLEEATQQELRWHLAAMIPRLPLNQSEIARAWAALNRYLNDRSSIVKTFALQGIADLARIDPTLREIARDVIEDAARKGTDAMKARARKLLRAMGKAAS